MENKNQNTNVNSVIDDGGVPMSSGLGVVPEPMDNSPEALSLDPTTLAQPPPTEVKTSQPAKNFFTRMFKRADVVLVVLLVVGMSALLIATTQHKSKTPSANNVTSQYTTQQIPLTGLITTEQGASFGPSNVVINGTLKASGGLVITPSIQPNAPATGQLYYDQNTNQLAYFNGTQYISLTQQGAVVQSVGGITGAITLGGGLSVVGNQLTVNQPAAAANVSSIGGVTGAVTVGNGLKIAGSDLRNDGVVSLTPGTANLIVSNDGNGNLTISNVGGGSGTVTSGGGTVGRIAKFTGVQNVEDSLLSESGGTVTTNGNLAITGALSLSAALTVVNGGTGATSLTANGIVIGQGAGAVTTVTSGGAGLCLISTVGAPSFQACPSGSGVASLNGLTGALTLANASAVGSTVTIDNATTAAKGIASFNAANFSVAGGAVNTIQDINTGATPTFTGVNTNTITPSGAFTVGALAQMFTLRGSAASTITATNAGSTTTVGFQTPTANVNYQFPTTAAGTYDICSTAGNCAGSGGGVTTPGGTNNTIAKFTGSQTLGNSNISDTGALVTITGNASVTGSLLLGAALGVGSGGTGATALTNNGVVIGQGSSSLTTVSAGGGGLCFLSTAGAPIFAACPTGGVTSLNGLTGALSIANASGVGSTVTINDATTAAKGIASFNGTNFTVTAGAVNTIQDIATSAAPTFGQLTLTSSQATNPMLLINNTNGGASGNLLDLQVSASSKFSVQPNGNTTTAGTINGQTISSSASLTGTLAVAGNTTLTGDIAVNGGDITSAGALNITPGGALTVGATTQTLALQGGSSSSFAVTNGGNTTTVNFQAPTANVTYRFATAAAGSYDVCTTVGNCAGTGGGVTTAGGSTNRLPKFTAAQVIGDSTITDNGTTVTTTANLTVQGGTLTAGVANTQTGSLTLAYGSANFSGTVTPGALTANRTYTLPDANGTFCLNGASSCGFVTGSGVAFVQGGNSFATAADIGTNDGNNLNLRTNGTTQVSINSAGNTTFNGDVAVNGGDITSSGALNITPGGALTVGDTGQTLALQGGAGTTLKAVNGGNATTVNFQAPTANVTYRFATTAAGSYDICSTAGNCAGSGGGVTTGGGTVNRLAKFTGSQAINDSTISDNGTIVTTTANMVIQGGTGTIGVAGTTSGSLTLAYGGAAFSGTINTATLTADRTYTLPDVGGTFCLTSGNCLGGGGGGANTALSNLSSVAINTSLLPGAAGTINLGSATFPFGDLYIAGTSGTPGTNNFRVTGSATAARTITLPDASGTVCLNGAAACGFATGSGTAFLQNGNTFGVAGNLGTNDSNDLNLRTNSTSRITIAANGSDATFASNMDLIMQGATAYITNSQGQTHGESFGAGATNLGEGVAVGYNSSAFGGGVAVGARATTFSTAGTAIGTDSNAGYLGTALGNSAQAAQEGTALGYSSVVGAHNSVAIGNSATVNQQFSIAIGQSATTTATNQMVIGATGYEIDHIYVGAGVTSATPTDFALQGTGGNGTNVAGANVSITGGAGTGNANGGNVNIRVATPGGSGSSANVPATVLSLSGANGSALFKNTTNSATALEVQTSGGAPVFTVNTSTAGVAVGGTTSSTGNINSSGGAIQTGGTSRIDNSGNLVNIGNITGSGATNISAAGTLTVGNTGQILALQGNASSTFAVTGGGFTTTVGFTGTPVGAVTYNFDRAAAAGTYSVCTTAGNCLGGGAGGANTALSNLTGVAINTSLLPGAAGTINLGSGTLPFGDFYLAGTSVTPGTNNFKITGVATAARTITIPDASGTICLQSAAACGFAPTSGSGNYIQNQIGVNQTADFQISGAGRAATFNGTTGLNTGAVGGSQRIDASGNLVNIGNLTATAGITIASTGGANNIILNSAGTIELQDNTNVTGNLDASGTLAVGTANAFQVSAAGDVTLDEAANHTVSIAARATNAAGRSLTLSGGAAGAGASAFDGGNVTVQGGNAAGTGAADGGTILIQAGNRVGSGETGQVIIQAGSGDRNQFLDVKNSVGQSLFIVNSASNEVYLGGNPINNSYDLTFSNDKSGVVRSIGAEDSILGEGQGRSILIHAGSSSDTNANGGSITLTAGNKNGSGTAGSVLVKNVADTTNTFRVQNAAGTTTAFAVDTTGSTAVSIAGGFTVQGTSVLNNNVTISGQGSSSNVALTVKANASQSGSDLIADFERSNGDTVARFTYNAGLFLGNAGAGIAGTLNIGNAAGNYGTINTTGLTGAHTYSLPNVDGTICTDAGNCGSATGTLQTGYNFSVGGTTPEIKLDGTRNGIDVQDSNGAGIGSGQNFVSFRGPNAGGLGAILFGVGTQGNMFVQPSTDRTDLFDINNNAGNNVFTIDSATSNGRVGIGLGGSTLPAYTLDVAGDANLTTGSAFRINGTSICTSSGCTPAAGSGNYIQNQNAGAQATANFWISGTGRSDTSVLTPLLDTASAVTLNIGASASGISLNQNTTVTGTKTFTVNGGLASLNAGVTAAGGAVQLNASSNNNTTINTGTSTGTVGIGNSLAGAITIQSGSTIGITTTNFNVSVAGVVTLTGNQTADITTAAVNTANGTGKSLTLAAGDETSGTCGTACNGGAIAIQGGNATGGAGTRNGGAVNIDGGTGNSSNGAINIGTINSSNVTIGKTTGGSSATLHAGTGGVTIGDGGVANTIQIGNATGAVAQTIAIGTNNTASSSTTLNVGNTLAGTTTSIYGGTNASSAILLVTGASGGIAIGGTANNTITIGATGLSGNNTTLNIADAIAGTQSVNIGSSTVVGNSLHLEAGNTGGLYIGGTNDSHTIHIGDSASGVQTLSIGSGNSTSALTLQSGTVGTSILSTGNVTVGTVDANGTLLVVDTKNTAGDPTGVNGAMYYNSNAGKFRCYQAGSWADCIAASGGFVSLQNAYTNSTGGTTSEIIVDNTRNALDVQDRSTSNGGSIAANLFNVRATAANDSTAGALLFGVSSTGSVTIAQNLTMTGASSYISNPQASFAAGESFGLNASVGTAVGSTAIGNGASAPNNRSVALGRLSNAAGDDGLAIGYQATLLNNGGTAIGSGTTAGFGSIALGFAANASNNNAIAINGTTTANNQMVIGASGGAISQVVIGSGVTAASPTGFTLQGTSGSGSNIAGASMTLAGGQSTGSANGGAVNIQVSGAGGAGASLNGLTTVASFDAAAGVTLGTSTLNTPVTIDSGTGTIGIGTGAQARTINLGTGAAVVQTISIGGTGANVIGVGNTQTAGSVNLGAAMTTGTINIGGAAQTGTLTLGRSTATNIINIGNATTATGNTQTVNIATSATGTGLAAVTMGNGNGASSMVLQAGTGGLQLTTQGTGVLAIGNNAVAQTVNIGNGTGGTAVSVLCGTGTCGFGNNNIDHSTTLGSLTGTSATNLQGGTGGLTVATASLGAINTGTVTIKSGNSAATAGNVSIDTGSTVTGTPTVNIGTGSAKAIVIGNVSGSSITLESGTGTINIGATATPRTINMGTGAGAMTVNVGSTASTSTTTIQGGTGNLNLLTNAANASIIAKSGTNGLAAFQVQDSGSVAYLTVNTSTSPGTYIAGTGTGGGGSKVYLGPVGDTSVYIGEQGATDTNILEMNALIGYSFLTGATQAEALSVSQNGYTKVTSINDSFGGLTVQQSTGNQTLIVGVGDAGSNHGEVRVGNYFDDIYATPLVLDTKTNAGDPTGTNGAMYYNSNANVFRCFQNSAWTNCITGAGAGLAKNAMDTSSAAVTAAGYLYGFTNSSSAVASGVLSLDNGTNTNSTLKVTASGNPTAGQALIFASNTNAAPTGNLIDLQAGSSPVSIFSVTGAGVVNVGAVGSSTIASTIHIADTTGTGVQAVTIGSAGNAADSVAILAGNTGLINIGSVGASTLASSVHIADTGDATSSQNVFIGSTVGSATKVTIKGGGASGFLKLNVGATGTLGIADGSADSTLNLGTGMTTGTINIGGTSQTGTTTIGNSGSTSILQIANGAGATTLALANVQTAGSVSIGAAMTTGTVTIGGAVAQTGTIILGQSTGTNTVRIGDGTGATTIQVGTGVTNAKTIQVGTGAAMANTISIGGTGANVITLGNTQTAGSISLGAAMTTGTITLGGAVAQTGTIIVGQSTGTNSVQIGNGTGATTVQIATGVTNAKTIQIGTGAAMANVISIGGTGANTITMGDTQTGGSVSIGAAMTTGTINIGGTAAQTGTINIGAGTGVQALNFGTGGTGAKTVTLGSSASTGLTTIQSGTLGISLLSTGNVKIGTSDTTGTLLVLDTKTDYTNHSNSNSEPTGVAGGMYYNSGLGQFRCYEVDHWRDCLVSARTVFKYVNDYIGTAQDNVMQVVGSGTGAGGTSTAGSTGHPGQVTLSTGTTLTGSGLTGANDNGTPFLLGNGDYWRFETDLQVPLLSNNDATNTYLIKAGMTDGGTAVPTDGCWFSYTHNVNAGKWQGNCANNTTASTCDTTITVAINTWYRLTFVANAAGTSVDFQVNGTSLCQVTTNIATTAGRETSMNISILKTASTTARTMLIDYLDLEGQFGSAR